MHLPQVLRNAPEFPDYRNPDFWKADFFYLSVGIPLLELSSIILHEAIRHFDSSRSNEVDEGRFELLNYDYARQCSNQLRYPDTWSVQVFEFLLPWNLEL